MKKIVLFKENGFHKIQTFNSFGHSYGVIPFTTKEKRDEYVEEIKKHWDFSGHEYVVREIKDNEKEGTILTIEKSKNTQNKKRFNMRLSHMSTELIDLALENNLAANKTELFEQSLIDFMHKQMPQETFDILTKKIPKVQNYENT